MMMFAAGLMLGLVVGACIGFLMAAVLTIAKKSDERFHDLEAGKIPDRRHCVQMDR